MNKINFRLIVLKQVRTICVSGWVSVKKHTRSGFTHPLTQAVLTCLCLAATTVLSQTIPTQTMVKIVRAEDERRFDADLETLLRSNEANIRRRAALAAGRIGSEKAIPQLVQLLEKGTENGVRAMAAFALGEIESIQGADAILKVLQNPNEPPEIRARAVEAAGKIAAANSKETKAKDLGEAILNTLKAESNSGKRDKLTTLLALTAALRAKPNEADLLIAKFLNDSDARIRADAANALARLQSKNANSQLEALLSNDTDAVVRANVARALGSAKDQNALEMLLNAATKDQDSRVRVSAIRALGSLGDKKAAETLLEYGNKLLINYKKAKPKTPNPTEKNELLEIATTLGRLLPNSNDEKAVKFFEDFHQGENYSSPEIIVAWAKVSPKTCLQSINFSLSLKKARPFFNWQKANSFAQALGEMANSQDKEIKSDAENALQRVMNMGNKEKINEYRSISEELRAFVKFKTNDLPETLRNYLQNKDVIVRATAIELLGELPPEQIQFGDFEDSFRLSLDDLQNDALMATIEAVGKQKSEQATNFLKDMFSKTQNFVARTRIAQLLKEKGESEWQNKIGNAQTIFKLSDYTRAVSRKNGTVKAVLTTEKGVFTIDFLPEDAPLTVDNFVKLARSGYFNGVSVHRVVPNFVMQDGDPRGDGNGGPGWEIRCEINLVPYGRGAVGMALSGKDTGGSQWFVTHSPQPHLDGGYTVFGQVNEKDMKVVDSIVRGDKILSVRIIEAKTQKKK